MIFARLSTIRDWQVWGILVLVEREFSREEIHRFGIKVA
jgi:hypothetical protein